MSETNQTERPVRRPRVLMVSLKENEVEAMCKALLANTVIENYSVEVMD